MAGEVCASVFQRVKRMTIATGGNQLPRPVQRPTMKFVATKTVDQLDFAGAAPGCAKRFVGQRTGIINQIRAFMLERGKKNRGAGKGCGFLRAELPGILANANRCALAPHVAQSSKTLMADWRKGLQMRPTQTG